jgi:PP-loop superfamily ATP-utilizing enzyme
VRDGPPAGMIAMHFTGILKEMGFQYVTLDLEGYRQGSL